MVKKLAIVTCKYCGKQFNRDILPFVQIPAGTRFRYAHSDCYKDVFQNGIEKNEYEIVDPKDNVMCAFCKKPIKKSSADCVDIGGGRYMHTACAEKDKLREKTPQEKLYEFLMTQCHYEFVPPNIQKQIQKMIEQNGYTYSGIHGTLRYWYIVKGEPIYKDNPVGIVPYKYEEAKEFYKLKQQLKQKNQEALSQTTAIKYITIKKPIIEKKKSTAFSFLDEEGANE